MRKKDEGVGGDNPCNQNTSTKVLCDLLYLQAMTLLTLFGQDDLQGQHLCLRRAGTHRTMGEKSRKAREEEKKKGKKDRNLKKKEEYEKSRKKRRV